MDLSAEKPDVQWYNSSPGKGAIYDLTSTAISGTGMRERVRAVVALGKSDDPRAVRPLMDLLSDNDPEIRISATTALGQLKSGRAVEALTRLLKERNEQVFLRQQAAVSLAAIRSTGAIRVLKEYIASEDEDPAVRSYVIVLMEESGHW